MFDLGIYMVINGNNEETWFGKYSWEILGFILFGFCTPGSFWWVRGRGTFEPFSTILKKRMLNTTRFISTIILSGFCHVPIASAFSQLITCSVFPNVQSPNITFLAIFQKTNFWTDNWTTSFSRHFPTVAQLFACCHRILQA